MKPNDPQTINAQVEAIWTAHHDATRRFLLRKARTADDELIDDAISEAALRLQSWLARGKAIEYPRAWLRRVTWHEYLRAARRADRSGRLALDNEAVDGALDDRDEAGEIVDALAAEELADAFAAALGRLSERQRTVVLDYARGRSYKEIAERHNLSATAVNKAILRAKRNLANNGRLAQAVQRSHG